MTFFAGTVVGFVAGGLFATVVWFTLSYRYTWSRRNRGE